ncbi:flagellar motor switch protein FliN [Salinisphaera sp. Q1T1-3]|uniref:flagellar motor switch protein FliN n=1 Tax=Salinisphaera sp. Q1T1-3 TaxID=2321229 RepID=UPI000E75A470|nr:flagellar motor switch protein FliN [Salinisphaera sp. Q1T1-3]RJS95158.1 flagellar motor switch protein FliN [Salinisphaera sp. Q1T1-3]
MTDSPKDDTQNQTGTDDAWAEALAEQAAAESGGAADDWAEAMAEQQSATAPQAEATPRNAGDDVFRPLTGEAGESTPRDLEMIMEIPVTLSVELGSTRLTIRELLDLAKGSIVELDGLAGEPMDILVNGYLVAQGEVVVVEDKYGIRITDIVDRAERIGKLNR